MKDFFDHPGIPSKDIGNSIARPIGQALDPALV